MLVIFCSRSSTSILIKWRKNSLSFTLLGPLQTLGPLGPWGPNSFTKSEFFFFSSFFRYLCNGESSGGPTLIWTSTPQSHFTTGRIFRARLWALRKTALLRHVTSRHVLWQSIYSATVGHPGYYVPPWVNFFLCALHNTISL